MTIFFLFSSNDPFWGVGQLFVAYGKFPPRSNGNTLVLKLRCQSDSFCSTDLISSPGLHHNGDDDFMNPLAAGKRTFLVDKIYV